jgi:hypothetical protein
LDVIAPDISSAYMQAFEKVNVIAGPKFGQLKGRIMIIIKALFGQKTSGAR